MQGKPKSGNLIYKILRFLSIFCITNTKIYPRHSRYISVIAVKSVQLFGVTFECVIIVWMSEKGNKCKLTWTESPVALMMDHWSSGCVRFCE